MITPTRAQVQVLKSLQNQSVTLASMLAEATRHQQHSGQRPPPSWYEVFYHRAIRREALTNAALAGGVPPAWIDHVRERGDRTVPWNPDLYLRTLEPLKWDEILGSLDTHVQRLCEWTALAAAYGPIAARAEDVSTTAGFDHNLQTLRARTTGVANLLGVNAEQAQQLWGAEVDWVATGVAMLDGIPVEGLAHRWRDAAHADTTALNLQARVLSAAGIAIDKAVALPSHEALKPAIGAALTPPTPLFLSAAAPGADVEAAIGAANLTYGGDAETGMDAPSFSDSAGAEAWSGDLAPNERPSAALVWQETGL
ncbi:hypothetical protein [Nocardia pseudovaccinii]|uniref:hypothetical protein n=1 Tax=Nocardia pseudovaccinii TaxID=189540 RepID=UPI0007A4B20B|nr:hypothetical protein [Nocardia pseudovaccinii]